MGRTVVPPSWPARHRGSCIPGRFKTFRPANFIENCIGAMSELQLLDTPANPLPPGAEPIALRTADGIRLRAVSWPAAAGTTPRGRILLLQGRAEFVEKYYETVGTLRARGFAVVTFDWRGQGGSDRVLADGRLGHVRHFSDFRLDYEAALECASGDGPLIVLAHSMGGAIALAGAAEGWLRAEALVCINPMVGLSLVKAEPFARRLARLLAGIGLAARMVPGGVGTSISTLPFPGNRLSTDPARYERNAALAAALGTGAIGSPSIGWLVAAYEAMDALSRPSVAGSIALPVLVALSESDPVCSTPAITRLAKALPNARTLVLPGARHEILMETDAILARFWGAFDHFVSETLQP